MQFLHVSFSDHPLKSNFLVWVWVLYAVIYYSPPSQNEQLAKSSTAIAIAVNGQVAGAPFLKT